MTTIKLPGYHSQNTCEAIKRLMSGRTFMDFEVSYSNQAGNCTLCVSTVREDTSEAELRDMFTHCLLSEVADLEEVTR